MTKIHGSPFRGDRKPTDRSGRYNGAVDSTWAFCHRTDPDTVLAALEHALSEGSEGSAWTMSVDPEEFFLAEDQERRDESKAQWQQVPYYVASGRQWTCFTYASGGEPFELNEPGEVSRRGPNVLEVAVGEEDGSLSLTVWRAGEAVLRMGPDGAFHAPDATLDPEGAARVLAESFGSPADGSQLSGSAWQRAEAVLGALGISAENPTIEYFEPEDVYADGHIFAFTRG